MVQVRTARFRVKRFRAHEDLGYVCLGAGGSIPNDSLPYRKIIKEKKDSVACQFAGNLRSGAQ